MEKGLSVRHGIIIIGNVNSTTTRVFPHSASWMKPPGFPSFTWGLFFVQESRLGGTSLCGAFFFPFLHR